MKNQFALVFISVSVYQERGALAWGLAIYVAERERNSLTLSAKFLMIKTFFLI